MVSEHEWNTVEWLDEARNLHAWLDSLESGPTLLMVRHSERSEDIDVPTTLEQSSQTLVIESHMILVKDFQIEDESQSITARMSGLHKLRKKLQEVSRRVEEFFLSLRK